MMMYFSDLKDIKLGLPPDQNGTTVISVSTYGAGTKEVAKAQLLLSGATPPCPVHVHVTGPRSLMRKKHQIESYSCTLHHYQNGGDCEYCPRNMDDPKNPQLSQHRIIELERVAGVTQKVLRREKRQNDKRARYGQEAGPSIHGGSERPCEDSGERPE